MEAIMQRLRAFLALVLMLPVLAFGQSGVYRFPGQIQGANGSVGSPQYSWSSDPNTGMYSAGADSAVFAAGGVGIAGYETTGFSVLGGLPLNFKSSLSTNPSTPASGLSLFARDNNQLYQIDTAGKVTQIGEQTLAQIAGVNPTLDLQFDSPRTFDRITYARTSIGTYFDADGWLKIAAAGVPRIEYEPVTKELKGFLIEESRANLVTNTEQFDATSWAFTRSTVAQNVEIAPDGSRTAAKLVEDTSTGARYVLANNVTVSASTTYTASAYFKAGERGFAGILLGEGAVSVAYAVKINLSDGSFAGEEIFGSPTSTAYRIYNVGNGWFRLSVAANVGAFTTMDVRLYVSSSATLSYTGDGKSGIYVWGAQLEAGAFPTSYAPSTQAWTDRTGSSGTANATFYNSAGILQTTSGAVARTTYNPNPDKLHLAPKLLLEPERTNLFLQSENLNTTWSITRGTPTASTTTTPDGDSSSKYILLVNDGTSGSTYARQSVSVTSGVAYTGSYYFKRGTHTGTVSISNFNGSSVSFNPETKEITFAGTEYISGSIVELPNGWFRLIGTFIASSTATYTVSAISFTASVGTTAYCWGAQLEEGYGPTSYIATTTATVKRYADSHTSTALTRAADNASMTGTAFSDWYRFDEGTIYAEADSNGAMLSGSVTSGGVFSVSSSPVSLAANSIYVQLNEGSGIQLAAFNSGSSQGTTAIPGYTFGSTVKIAGGIFFNNAALQSSTSPTPATDTSFNTPTAVNRAYIGSNVPGSRALNGHIKRLAFFPARLSNAILRKLTEKQTYSDTGVATKYRSGYMPPITNTFAEAQEFLGGLSLPAGQYATLNQLTASQAVFTDASKRLVSNAVTGTGSVAMSASPTFTGTASFAEGNFSSFLRVGGTAPATPRGRIGYSHAGGNNKVTLHHELTGVGDLGFGVDASNYFVIGVPSGSDTWGAKGYRATTDGSTITGPDSGTTAEFHRFNGGVSVYGNSAMRSYTALGDDPGSTTGQNPYFRVKKLLHTFDGTSPDSFGHGLSVATIKMVQGNCSSLPSFTSKFQIDGLGDNGVQVRWDGTNVTLTYKTGLWISGDKCEVYVFYEES